MKLRLIALLVTIVALTSVRSASASPTQVSDMFRRVARAVARDLTIAAVTKACEGADKHKELCAALTKELASLVADVIGGSTSTPSTLQKFRKTLQRTFAAVAIVEVHEWGERHFASILGDELAKKALPALDCVAEYVLTGDKAKCTELIAVGSAFTECFEKDDVGDKAVCVLDEIAKQLPDSGLPPEEQDVLASVRIGVLILDDLRQSLAIETDLFDAVQRMFRKVEDFDYLLSFSVNSHGVFDAGEINAAISACDAHKDALTAFQAKRLESYEAYANAIVTGASFDGIPAELKIPVPQNQACTSNVACKRWCGFARGFTAHGELSSALHKVEVPALVVAALVDIIRDGDADLRRKALAIGTHALRRQFGKASSPTSCKPTAAANTFDCKRVDGGTFSVTHGAAVADELVDQMIEGRRGARAAETNCLVQLVTAAVASEPLSRDITGGTMCWMDQWGSETVEFARILGPTLSVSTDITVTAGAGTVNTPVVYEWDPASIVGEAPETFRLAIAYRTIPDRFLDFVAEKMEADLGIDKGLIDTAKRILRSGNADAKTMAVGLAIAIGKVIEEPVKRLLEKLYPAECPVDGKTKVTTVCAVRALATVFMETAVYASIRTEKEDELIDELVRKAGEIKETVLDQSPFLFEVGLGFNSVGTFTGENDEWAGWSRHFTILDKWGAVTRKDDWYLGVFVGGFVDAIIRDEERRFLAGFTGGKRRLTGGLPLGFSAHLAYAAPFDTGASFKAFSFGVSLTVPTTYLYDE